MNLHDQPGTQINTMDEDHQEKARWRTGNKLGRTIYAMVGEYPNPDDVLLGIMDSPGIAQSIVDAHNHTLGLRLKISG